MWINWRSWEWVCWPAGLHWLITSGDTADSGEDCLYQDVKITLQLSISILRPNQCSWLCPGMEMCVCLGCVRVLHWSDSNVICQHHCMFELRTHSLQSTGSVGIWLLIQLEEMTLNEMRAGISKTEQCKLTEMEVAGCFFAVSEPTAAVSLHKWGSGGEKMIDSQWKENSGILLWLWSQCSAVCNNNRFRKTATDVKAH